MAENRPSEETPFEAALRSAIMQSGRTFDHLEAQSKVSSQAIGRFVNGSRGLTSWSAGRLMEALNLVVLSREVHEKLGNRFVAYNPIEIEERPTPRPRGRPKRVPHHGSAKGKQGGVSKDSEPRLAKVLITEPVTPHEFKEIMSKKRGRPPKVRRESEN